MQVQALGHVVLKVQSLQRSERFYSGVLGLPVADRISEPVHMTLFTLGNHHDFGVLEVGDQAPRPDGQATGLAHVAFKVGDSISEFQSARTQLEATGIEILYEADRDFTKSMHMLDPDRNEVELYIDTSDAWKTHAPAIGYEHEANTPR